MAVLRLRPWSAVLRVPIAVDELWFKESAPSLAFEPALTQALAARWPDRVPEVVAAEGTRLLMRNAGPRLRELLDDGLAAPAWEEILPLLAELQVGEAEHVDELLARGTPDLRPELLPDLVAPLAPELEPEVRRLTGELRAEVPPSVSHEEVHDGNIFVRDRVPILGDWGEACISHPFCGLVNTFRVAVHRYAYAPGGPEVARLRDAYLEPWSRFARLDELRADLRRACRLGAACRALTWERILAPLPPAARAEHDHAIAVWLDLFREGAELGA